MTEGNGPRVRNVCFTINRDGEHDLLLLDPTHESWVHCKYLIYQREMEGHEHFQGYLELTNAKTYAALHAMQGLEFAHFQKRYGSAKQASHYCRKPVKGCDCEHCTAEARNPTKLEGPWEFGEMSHQGASAALLEVKADLDRGVSLKRISDDHFPEWVRHNKSLKEYRRTHTAARTFPTIVCLFVGPAGTQKSTLMKLIASHLGTFYKVPAKKGSGLYFDDYDSQDTLIIDEFSGATMPPEFFNLIADEHECVLPVHGGAGHQMVSKYLFIGSNYCPKWWWSKRNARQLKQTTRRIHYVFKRGFHYDPQYVQELFPGQFGYPESRLEGLNVLVQ